MRFNRLRLNGFKSFVDPTDLIIGDGLTGVVGPNGCGKSNLLEALRWVMGENRPTAMRGGGMEDVIFAGAASRPARNFAEVALIMDNSDRRAPAGFNDTDQLEIIRRITRDVGSAYKTNGKDVRARDVQMLFADASTGAHSPALVRQGQISELINAKPKARRRILEEAAGISGLYQRRHEAELKLKGAEANLDRVDDVLEALAAQLSTLARQAKQAARYREIGTQLRQAEGLLLYRRWREADEARLVAVQALTARTTEAGAAETAARQAAQARVKADEALPPLREEEAIAGAVVQRLHVQRDTLADQETRARDAIETLTGRITTLEADIAREEGLNKDAGETIDKLEWEQGQIAKAAEGHDEKLAEAAEAARAAGEVLTDRETTQSEMTEDVARLAARHQSTQRLLQEATRTEARAQEQAAKADTALSEAQSGLTQAEARFAEAGTAQTAAQAETEAAEAALTEAEAKRSDIQGQEADARAARSEAEGEATALRAEVGALEKLVARDRAEGGQVLDAVTAAPGFEAALGAALADDLKAPQVDGDRSGWHLLPGYDSAASLPEGATPLGSHVTVPGVLARRMAQVGLVDRADGARLQAALRPGQRLVSREGDLWRWDGLAARAEDAPSAAAARLQQINRLSALKADLEQAEAQASTARASHEALQAELRAAAEADRLARDARKSAERALGDASRALSRAEADKNIMAGKLETLSGSVARYRDEVLEARKALSEAQTAQAGLGDLEAARAQVEAIRVTVDAARMTMLAKRSAHDELRREGEARTRRSQEITQQISGWRHRLETAEAHKTELEGRLAENRAELKTATAAPGEIASKRDALAHEISRAEARKAAAADALSTAEGAARKAEQAERDAERAASEAREARAASEARAEAAAETVALAADRIQEALEVTPQQLLDTLKVDADGMPAAEAIEAEVNRLKRQRDAMGAVNLRAEEDAKAVDEEYQTLTTEKGDLEGAIGKLRTGISSLNKEGRERLLTAFEQVNENFSMLFTHLFGGGEAKLVLVESDDPLEAGLEIMCQPPGKRLSTLSLLSGGEQTLTALALIFAVFLANPAPICVLDEVDAPLDDANVTRFCDLLDEMTRRTETRFLIITHHAVTMARMDRLFGVTMGEQGVSQLVSVDLRKAETLVA
ncbi:chromosome segregation protein SMC [Dinoroseobacter sp. S124A]|uniref:chromosome segregation protein SMC n=1 Tax=Dinoroseobacter sp. S124A TaxID=3415128 RepID=UPI003C7B5CA9